MPGIERWERALADPHNAAVTPRPLWFVRQRSSAGQTRVQAHAAHHQTAACITTIDRQGGDMYTIHTKSGSRTFAKIAAACSGLLDEASLLASSLLRPGKVIDEVERMAALQREAYRVEASDPARAAALRRRMSRIGLR